MRGQKMRFETHQSDDDVRRIVEEYFAAKRGRQEPAPDYAEIVRNLLTMYEVGDAIWHILSEHGPDILEGLINGS